MKAAGELAIREGCHSRLHVCSDNMTIFTASQNITTVSNYTLRCHNAPKSFDKETVVELICNSGHNGFRGHEMADDCNIVCVVVTDGLRSSCGNILQTENIIINIFKY